MNVERMRRYMARNDRAYEPVAWRRRLAAMTPEHRAKHTGPWGRMACTQCFITASSRPATRRDLGVSRSGVL